MNRRVLLLVVSLTLSLVAHAQPAALHPEAGRPFLTCFTPDETGGGNQEWVFAQDQRGVLYVGDNLGVLEYDGASWRLITTATNNVVRALDVDAAGRLYVGSSTDFGYLAPDDAGETHYVSLLHYVPEEDRTFNDIWTVHARAEGVYFQARERLFRLSERPDGTWQVQVWRPQGVFYYAFWLDGVYYVHQGGVGLMRMTGDTLDLLPGGEQFADERLQVMLPYGDGTYLVGPFSRGLFRFDGQGFTPFETEADAYLRANTLYKGTVLPDGTFGLATIAGGYAVIDQRGRLVQVLNQSRGLPSDIVYAVFVDRSGLVWLSPENSICQYEAHSPLSRFDASSGLDGFTSDLFRHQGTLYVSTSSGAYYLDTAAATFRPIAGLSGGNPQVWSFLQVDEDLLVATGTGISQIEGRTARAITQNILGVSSPSALHRSRQDPNRVFVGRSDGLGVLRRDAGTWFEESVIPGITQEIRSIVEPEPGLLWLGSQTQGTMRVRFAAAASDNPVIDHFGPEDGLPGAGGVSVYEAAGRLVFAMRDGISRFDEATGRFEPDPLFSGVVGHGGSAEEYSVVEDRQGDIWINFGKETAVLRRQADGSYQPEKTALLRFADEAALDIYPEADGVVWFGGNGSLIRYDRSIQKDYTVAYPALVRRVTIGEDSTLFGGATTGDGSSLRLRFADNALRFEYAATSYDNPKETRYASMLDGFDEHWSSWTRETRRTYTNLPPGAYAFRVKAQNIYEHESSEATFAFRILPPWYRTGWAYGLYAVLFALGVFAVDRIQRRRLITKERERAQLREAELRAREAEARSQAAEANAKALQAENERKQNVELLSEIGRAVTATLSIKQIIDTVYENVNALMDASVFGIGIYHEDDQRIDFPATKEKGKTLPPFFNRLDDEDRLAVWCFKNRQEIVSNDYGTEYLRYVKRLQNPVAGEHTESILYLPLVHQDRVIGVITAQSFEKGAYTEHHVNILRNLATYTAIALDNADAYRRLNATLEHLKATQEQLVTQEKLASLGQLTAGIAHEIKNPLNFVNNFAEVNVELVRELSDELAMQKDKRVVEVLEELDDILSSLKINASQIRKHGRRADAIVKNMMEHAGEASGERYPVDVNAFVDEYVGLSYHGMRAQVPGLDVRIERRYGEAVGNVEMTPQEIGRVLLNLLHNAFEAVHERTGKADGAYTPTVTVSTQKRDGRVVIRVADNGLGIPAAIQAKIFEPFFTTKPSGSGTGLGLSLSYDIVTKGHGGTLTVESDAGRGATFVVTLPAARA